MQARFFELFELFYPSYFFFHDFSIKLILQCTLNAFDFNECKIINSCHDLLDEVFLSFVDVA